MLSSITKDDNLSNISSLEQKQNSTEDANETFDENEDQNETETDVSVSEQHSIYEKHKTDHDFQLRLQRWKEFKDKETKVEERILNVDHQTPRTIADFKNWNLRQSQMQEYNILQQKRKSKSEEIKKPIDIARTGHISQALRLPSLEETQDALQIKKLRENKMDFSLEPTFIEEGVKYIPYYYQKYFMKFAPFSMFAFGSTGIYFYYHIIWRQDWNNTIITQWLIDWRPTSALKIAMADDSSFNLLYYTLDSCSLPLVFISILYAKIAGEIWEWNQLKNKSSVIPNAADFQSSIKTRQKVNKYQSPSEIQRAVDSERMSANTKLIFEIALIRERRKQRKKALAPVSDVVDVMASFGPVKSSAEHEVRNENKRWGILGAPKRALINAFKLKVLIDRHGLSEGSSNWMSSIMNSSTDPRKLPSTQQYGVLQLQTRIDEFGRAIPGWQRESTVRWIVPAVVVFFGTPQIVDWMLAWGV